MHMECKTNFLYLNTSIVPYTTTIKGQLDYIFSEAMHKALNMLMVFMRSCWYETGKFSPWQGEQAAHLLNMQTTSTTAVRAMLQ
jgi:hypothetical protein